MLLESIDVGTHLRSGAPGPFDGEQMRTQFERVHAAIVDLGLPARPLSEAYRRQQALRADYVPQLWRLNDALLAPFEFRTHARPIPVEMG